MADTDHVVVNCRTSRVECLRCGESWKLPLPMGVTAFVKMVNAYVDDHRLCKPKETETVGTP